MKIFRNMSKKTKKYLILVLAFLFFCLVFSSGDDENSIDTTTTTFSIEQISENENSTTEAQISTSENSENLTGQPTETQQSAITEALPLQSEIVLPADSSFSVQFIDVGQADAALVECDGHYMLIDGGNKGDSNLIYSVLKRNNISNLDIVVATHAHEDHIGGLSGAFNYATADLTLCPVQSYDSDAFESFASYANQKGNGIVVPQVADQYMLGSASVTILGVNADNDTNNTSIVLKIQYGKTSFLFTGDAEREAEQAILADNTDLSATVLKVGHHGSDTSTTYPFLREIMPAYAVISVGKGNSYGHPTDETLSKLRDADVEVFRTDINGDIVFTSDGNTVSVSVAKQGSDTTTTAGDGEKNTTQLQETTKAEQSNESNYIVNINTGKFHETYCSSVKKMKESNKKYYTGTRDDLIADGYSPCGNCNP